MVTRQRFTPKGLVYPTMTIVLVGSFVVMNTSDQLMQEQDFVIDSLLLTVVACMWMTQPAFLRQRDLASVVVIILCIKFAYWADSQRGLNTQVDPDLEAYRKLFKDHSVFLQFLPLVMCIFLENKIARHYSFGAFHKL